MGESRPTPIPAPRPGQRDKTFKKYVSDNTAAILTLQGQVSTLQATVAAQATTIAGHTTAIATINARLLAAGIP